MSAERLTTYHEMSQLIKDLETTPEQKRQLWDRVIGAIRRDNGKHYNQDGWTGDQVIEGSCGTTACIAGHAVHEAVALGVIPPFSLNHWDLEQPARRLLGVSRKFGDDIFLGINEDQVAGRHDELLAFLGKVRDNCDDSAKLDALAAEFTVQLRKEPVPVNPDDETADGDDLIALGFKGCNDEHDTDVYDKQLGVGRGGPIVRVYLTFSRGELVKSGMGLHWDYQLPTHKISMAFAIRDNPTIGDVKRLLAELDPK